jgi:hypothetical protein
MSEREREREIKKREEGKVEGERLSYTIDREI